MRAILVIACLLSSALAYGEDILDRTEYFDISAQSLNTAVVEFAKQAKLEVSADGEMLRRYRAPGFKGRESARAALTKLLAESGLVYHVVQGTVQIRPAERMDAKETSYVQPSTLWAQPVKTAGLMARSDDTPAGQQAPLPAAASERRRIEEVIVSAQRRRDERLLETPISMGVLSGEDLDRSSSRGVADILNQVGGVALTEIQPGKTDIVVRGVVPGTGTNTTAYYLDEIPFAFIRISELPDSNTFDLERIEVLRGPQGTLYGANSMSGVLRVLTHDPDLDQFDFKGRSRVSSTEDGGNNYGGDFAINVPLVDGKLAMRAVAGYSELSGFIDSTDSFKPVAARVPASEINDTTAENYRFKMAWHPTEDFRALLQYSRSDIHNDSPSQAFDDMTTPFPSYAPDDRVLDMYNLVLEYDWSSVSLLSSTGYIGYSVDTRQNFMLTATVPIDFLYQIRLNSFTQELRVVSELAGPWQWSAGAYYSDSQHRTLQDARATGIAALRGVFISGAISESYAAFGEVTRSFNDDRFDVTFGLRYFNDRATLQDLGSFNPAAILVPDQTNEFDETTGRVVLTYKASRESMFYASMATGFRSGMVQSPEVVRNDPSFAALEPDTLTSYELGTKGYLFDGALGYDTAVYYMDWEDIQQSLVLPIGFTARLNAGSASGVGADLALNYQLGTAFNFWTSVGWNDLTFDQDVYNFNAGQSRLLFKKGSRLNNSPEWTGSVGASVRTAAWSPGMDFTFSTSYSYGSERSLRFLNAGILRVSDSDVIRLLKASVGLAGERWSLDVYGDNLTNDGGRVAPPDSAFANTSVRQRPRTIGLQLAFQLGN